MRNTDFGNSFTKLKNQLFMEDELMRISDEKYNIGIDRCINFCKSQVELYKCISPHGNEWRAIESIAKTLEYFKKPIKEEAK
jgi:hypothetical protein